MWREGKKESNERKWEAVRRDKVRRTKGQRMKGGGEKREKEVRGMKN